MKKIILLILAAAVMSSAAYSQKISADKVPASVSSAFKAKFPNVKAKWELEKTGDYEAGFTINGQNMSATFDKSGSWIETEREMKVSDLPAPVIRSLKKDFSDYKVKETSKIESEKNGNSFEAEIEKGESTFDALFSADGKLLSKIKVEEEKGEKDEKGNKD